MSIDPSRVAALLEPADPAVSLYFPINPEQRDPRDPAVRMRQRTDEAAALLQSRGASADILAPLHDAQTSDFARHRDPGLAFFIAPGRADVIALPEPPPDLLVVGTHFHIKPLLPLLAHNRRFHILALSAGNLRLLTATPFTWAEHTLAALPADAQAELDARAAAAEGRDEHRRALMLQDPRHVAFAVRAALGADDDAPIVLAADPQVAGKFLKTAPLPSLLPTTVAVNPFALTDSELHARAMEVIAPSLDTELDRLIEQLHARLGTAESTVAIRLEEILAAGAEGRVDAVVVASDETLWGRYEPGRVVAAHGHPSPGDEDLVNLAAVATLRAGGRAFAAPRERLPRHAPAAATLRF